MRRVIIESPYAGDVVRNLRYLRACMRDCLDRGEAPFASHGLYTQTHTLDDSDPAQRTRGIEAGFAWKDAADATVVYDDLGISLGMLLGIDRARSIGQYVETRTLGPSWETNVLTEPHGLKQEKLTVLLYLLLRDAAPAADVISSVKQVVAMGDNKVEYTSKELEALATRLAHELLP